MPVEFKDYSMKVKGELNDVTKAWLTEWSNEIASQAKDNVQLDGEAGNKLRDSYRATRRYQNHAWVGTPEEAGYWEEFGTGEHAVKSPHRTGWWLYFEGGSGYEGETNHYATREEAEKMAAYIKKKYGKTPKITDGRDPSYTLQNAFMVSAPKAEADLERKLKERFGK